MTEQEAESVATHVTTRWPGRVQASIVTSQRDGQLGFAVLLAIPECNRRLRLVRDIEVEGALDICAVLLSDTSESEPLSAKRQYAPRPRLTAEDCATIRARYGVYVPCSAGHARRPYGQTTIMQLAQEYGVSRATIATILRKDLSNETND